MSSNKRNEKNESYVKNSIFYGVYDNPDCKFSIVQIPGESGYTVKIEGVKVIPATHYSFSKFPGWLIPICMFFGAKSSHP